MLKTVYFLIIVQSTHVYYDFLEKFASSVKESGFVDFVVEGFEPMGAIGIDRMQYVEETQHRDLSERVVCGIPEIISKQSH